MKSWNMLQSAASLTDRPEIESIPGSNRFNSGNLQRISAAASLPCVVHVIQGFPQDVAFEKKHIYIYMKTPPKNQKKYYPLCKSNISWKFSIELVGALQDPLKRKQ
jgi:hypothetical protein